MYILISSIVLSLKVIPIVQPILEIVSFFLEPNFINAEIKSSILFILNFTITSPGSNTVFPGPNINSEIFISFNSLFFVATTTVASNINKTGNKSPAGEALAIFPPIVPLFLICNEPTSFAASLIAVKYLHIIGDFSNSVCVTYAPISTYLSYSTISLVSFINPIYKRASGFTIPF